MHILPQTTRCLVSMHEKWNNKKKNFDLRRLNEMHLHKMRGAHRKRTCEFLITRLSLPYHCIFIEFSFPHFPPFRMFFFFSLSTISFLHSYLHLIFFFTPCTHLNSKSVHTLKRNSAQLHLHWHVFVFFSHFLLIHKNLRTSLACTSTKKNMHFLATNEQKIGKKYLFFNSVR